MPSIPVCDVFKAPVVGTPPLLGQSLYTLVVPPAWTELDVLSPIRPLKIFRKQWSLDWFKCVPKDQLLRHIAKGLAKFAFRQSCLSSLSAASLWLFPNVPRRNSALENLPTEILVDTLQFMGWRDILVCRQTCKRLLEISTVRRLWMSLFHRLSAELMTPLSVLEKPVDTYTTEELERIVLRRISFEIRWTSKLPPRVRNVPITINEAHEFAVLLEGGQWLLLTSSQKGGCRVYAYDLDSSLSKEPRCLIDLRESSDDPEQVWHIAADVDSNQSQLTFNLCLVPFSTYGPYPAPSVDLPPADIHIYRVTLNGHGKEAMFIAHKIKTLRNGFRALSSRISLRGRYLARSLNVLKPTSSSIEVCDWVLSDESTQFKFHITLERGIPQSIALLPDDKLIALLKEGVFLYNIANLQSVPPGKLANELRVQPYWKHSDPELYECAHLSKSYLHRDTTRVAIAMKGAIYGLVIPHDSNDDPWYKQLSDVDISRTWWASLGIDKAYVQRRNGSVEIASYLWPCDECKTSDMPSLLVPVTHHWKWDSPYEWCIHPLFDERTNRLFSIVEGGSCVVVDFGCE